MSPRKQNPPDETTLAHAAGQSRIRFFDGLRGILALIVLNHHFLYTFAPSVTLGGDHQQFFKQGVSGVSGLIALTPLNILFNPLTAIMFFFLLSGFVQTYNYFRVPDTGFLQRSFLKRYLRLVFPVLAVLLLVYTCHRLKWFAIGIIPANHISDQWVKSLLPDNLSFPEVLKHGVLDSFLSTSRYYQVLWTMPVELIHSWLVMIYLFVTHGIKIRRYLLLGWLLVQVFVLQTQYGHAFTMGALLADLHVSHPGFFKRGSHVITGFLLFIAGMYFSTYPFQAYEGAAEQSVFALLKPLDSQKHLSLYTLGVACMMYVMLNSPRIQNFLSKKWLLFLGEISFMIYLTHLLVVFCITPRILVAMQLSFKGEATRLVLTGVLTLLFTILLSTILYRLVDKPGLRWATRVVGKLWAPKRPNAE